MSGADLGLIPPLYQPMLSTCVSTLVSSVDGLVAGYLYGSVATGRASPPESDLDLLVVTLDRTASDDIDACAAGLTTQFIGLVHDVGIADVDIDGLFAENVDALGNRCFIKHYCVPVQGDDLRSRLPSCRPSPTIAWAFNHNVADAIDRARQRLDVATTSDDVQAVCRVAARKVLLAAASLMSAITSTWTTDRARAAEFVAEPIPNGPSRRSWRSAGGRNRPMIRRGCGSCSTGSLLGSPESSKTRPLPADLRDDASPRLFGRCDDVGVRYSTNESAARRAGVVPPVRRGRTR